MTAAGSSIGIVKSLYSMFGSSDSYLTHPRLSVYLFPVTFRGQHVADALVNPDQQSIRASNENGDSPKAVNLCSNVIQICVEIKIEAVGFNLACCFF